MERCKEDYRFALMMMFNRRESHQNEKYVRYVAIEFLTSHEKYVPSS